VNIETAHVKLYVLHWYKWLTDIAEVKKCEFTLLPTLLLYAAHGWQGNMDINPVQFNLGTKNAYRNRPFVVLF
jgi:hypothetical protein